jgi:short-subunit dehydrogenase
MQEVEHDLISDGIRVLAVETDVSDAASIERLASRTIECFGTVHVLCNNAGVGSAAGPLWERTVSDWEETFSVNIWGVIHGIRTFVPLMRGTGEEGHVLNTASINGFVPCPLLGIYSASKHAIVAISECLSAELAMDGSQLKVSVLCPGAVETQIADAERRRAQGISLIKGWAGNATNANEGVLRRAGQVSPSMVADLAFEAIKTEQFLVFTNPDHERLIHQHLDDITLETAIGTPESRLQRLMRLRRHHAPNSQ